MQGCISGVGNISSQQGGDVDTFVNITVDLTGITSSQTVNIKGKDYNKYELTSNNITVKSVTSLSDMEVLQISDLLHYKLFPLSYNNDIGLYLTYDGTILTAYVATNNTGETIVDFYFTYIYNTLASQSVTIENYIDILGGGSSGVSIYNNSAIFRNTSLGLVVMFTGVYSPQKITSMLDLMHHIVKTNVTSPSWVSFNKIALTGLCYETNNPSITNATTFTDIYYGGYWSLKYSYYRSTVVTGDINSGSSTWTHELHSLPIDWGN